MAGCAALFAFWLLLGVIHAIGSPTLTAVCVSVGDEVDLGLFDADDAPGRRVGCRYFDQGGSATVAYAVLTDGRCWTARPDGGAPTAAETSGCVRIADQFQAALHRVFD